jgi:hypothetical protein
MIRLIFHRLKKQAIIMRPFVLSVLCFCLALKGFAQKEDNDLFGLKTETKINKGVVLGINGNFDIPGGDLAKRFGNSFRVGGSVSYKTPNSQLLGVL